MDPPQWGPIFVEGGNIIFGGERPILILMYLENLYLKLIQIRGESSHSLAKYCLAWQTFSFNPSLTIIDAMTYSYENKYEKNLERSPFNDMINDTFIVF